MPRITVIGSLNMDLVVRAPRLPAPGETLLGSSWQRVPGGKGANQAVAAARLGAEATLVGRVGADDFGRALCKTLASSGVDITSVSNDSQLATGIATIEVQTDGQNTIIVVPGANAGVSTADVNRAYAVLTGCDAVIAQLEIPVNTVRYAFQLARESGVRTILNPAPAQPLDKEMYELADILVPNENEAERLTGIPVVDWGSAEAAAVELARYGGRCMILTLGARGALWWEGGRAVRVPAYPIQALDATAAGDAFVGALAVALACGKDMHASLREANAAGALTATRPGAQPALPTRAELETFLGQQNC